MDLSALGVKPSDIVDRVVERVSDAFLNEDEYDVGTRLDKALKLRIETEIARAVDRIGNETIAPKVDALIEGMTFQKTNGYGEPKAPAKTWREMLVEQAENWMNEPVNLNGQTNREESYNWRKHTTRLAYMVEKHIQYEIDKSVKAALADMNSKVAGGILAAVRISLQETLSKLKIEAKV